MSYARIRSHQTHNNSILHDFTSSASAISEHSNKECDNHALIKYGMFDSHLFDSLGPGSVLGAGVVCEIKHTRCISISEREYVFSSLKQNSIQRAGFQIQSSVRKLLYFLSTLLSCLTSIHCLPTVAR